MGAHLTEKRGVLNSARDSIQFESQLVGGRGWNQSPSAAMLSRLYADNYLCLANFELSLDPLSVLLGPNGSGKSASLLLVAKLRDFILGRENSVKLFPNESLTRWDTRSDQTFELTVRHPQGDYVYRLRLQHQRERSRNKIVEETLNLDGKPLFETRDEKTYLYNDRHSRGAEFLPDWNVSGLSRVHERHDNTKLMAFRKFFDATLVLALNPALVKAVSESKQPVTIPTPDCSDFAALLDYIIRSEAIVRQEAEKSLSTGALPGFRAFQATPFGDANILECVFSKAGSKSLKFRIDELSSGQVALIILEIALALATERGGSLLLDEPGNFLALSEISPLLTRLQDAAHEGLYQVIISAHHPVAVDFLSTGHGQWLDRDASGAARIQKIDVAGDMREKDAHLRVSDLIARGWLSGLGLQDHTGAEMEPERFNRLLSEQE
jgi:predicted ATPase